MLFHIPLLPVSCSDNDPAPSLPSTSSEAECGIGAGHLAVIADFFDAYGGRLPREWLWELLKAAMGSEQSGTWKAEQRTDYMQFCERLAELLDACCLAVR